MLWRATFVAVVICMLGSEALAQEQQLEFPESPTLWVDCDPQKQPKTLDIKGPTFIAKNGQHRANVELKVRVKGHDCFNTSTLWYSAGTTLEYEATYVQPPVDPGLWGNGMQIVDWSPDGRLLLTELSQWNTMPNDAGDDHRVLVFHPEDDKHSEIDLSRFINDQKGKDCFVQFQLLGFTPDSWVALKTKISTYYDEGDEPEDKPPARRCNERPIEGWKINPVSQERLPLPNDFKPEKYSLQVKDDAATTD